LLQFVPRCSVTEPSFKTWLLLGGAVGRVLDLLLLHGVQVSFWGGIVLDFDCGHSVNVEWKLLLDQVFPLLLFDLFFNVGLWLGLGLLHFLNGFVRGRVTFSGCRGGDLRRCVGCWSCLSRLALGVVSEECLVLVGVKLVFVIVAFAIVVAGAFIAWKHEAEGGGFALA
jgi:hypothetical protein